MRKSLNFDLDTNKLKEYYPNKNYTNAYEDIKKFLLKNGFEHRQGSGYISQKEMSTKEVADIMDYAGIVKIDVSGSIKEMKINDKEYRVKHGL